MSLQVGLDVSHHVIALLVSPRKMKVRIRLIFAQRAIFHERKAVYKQPLADLHIYLFSMECLCMLYHGDYCQLEYWT